MNRQILFVILLLFAYLVINAGDFDEYMDSVSIYNDNIDSLLVSRFPERTVMEMEHYLRSSDYMQHFIAYRILSCFSEDSIAHIMYSKDIDLVHIIRIAASMKDDTLFNKHARNGSVEEKTAYMGLLGRRNDPDDLTVISEMLYDADYSVRLAALQCLCEHTYSYMLNDSVIEYLKEYRKDHNFRENVIIENILEKITNNDITDLETGDKLGVQNE